MKKVTTKDLDAIREAVADGGGYHAVYVYKGERPGTVRVRAHRKPRGDIRQVWPVDIYILHPDQVDTRPDWAELIRQCGPAAVARVLEAIGAPVAAVA